MASATGDSELITLFETWGGIRLIPSSEIVGRAISTVRVGRELHVADVTSNAAVGFDVTSEICTTIDYALTQQWVAALCAAGFDGIRYWARHEMSHIHACLAVFASGGDRTSTPSAPSDYTVAGTDDLRERGEVWEALWAQTGIEVLDIPDSL